MMGGRIGVRKSFFQQYFSSIRSVTHGGTGIGVASPIEYQAQPLCQSGAVSATSRHSLRSFLIPLPPSQSQANRRQAHAMSQRQFGLGRFSWSSQTVSEGARKGL